MFRTKRASLMLEYAVVIGLVATALMAMQTYIKRGIQGTIKATADELGVHAQAYYSVRKDINLDSQSLGAWEKGLVKYNHIKDEFNSDSEIRLTGEPRAKEIIRDQTQTSGIWQITSSLAEGGTFSASERTKKPAEGVSAQATGAKVQPKQVSSGIVK